MALRAHGCARREPASGAGDRRLNLTPEAQFVGGKRGGGDNPRVITTSPVAVAGALASVASRVTIV